MIRVKYIDNSGNLREEEVNASTFRDAVQGVEHFANEAGWGIAAITMAVRTVEVGDLTTQAEVVSE